MKFLNIDCDTYELTRTVLEILAPQIISGTVIIFDEYIGNKHWREDEYKAFQEAVERYGWKYCYLGFSMVTKQVVVKILWVLIYPDAFSEWNSLPMIFAVWWKSFPRLLPSLL